MEKMISFDMDGTLIQQSFADSVWLEGLPRLYALHQGIRFHKAQKYLMAEYNTIGPEAIEWYDIQYWFKKLGLDENWKSFLDTYRHKIILYPEVHGVLQSLKDKYSLLIISNAAREFLTIELEETHLAHYFSHIFSAVTDFKQTKKDSNVYQQICTALGIDPSGLIHVGDNYCFDYLIPRKMGIISFYLNRTSHRSQGDNRYTLTNLRELFSKI